MNNKTDNLFAEPQKVTPFSFDKNVAEVFPDMIERSVPGYAQIIEDLKKIAAQFVQEDSHCYDLGCSLGAASLSMSAGIKVENVNIIAVDNSQAMLERCQQHINAFKHETTIKLQQGNIQDINITKASMVVLNFTLQFIAKMERASLLQKIYDGMLPGGILILSEKILFDDSRVDELLVGLHHQFKKENGYSDLEVSQKRNALENVLLPETLAQHYEKLKSTGFKHVNCWLQQYNFVSLLAIK